MVMYELRASRVQHIPAHQVPFFNSLFCGLCFLFVLHLHHLAPLQAPVTALAFNPDGKNLVTYSANENKLSFWQTR